MAYSIPTRVSSEGIIELNARPTSVKIYMWYTGVPVSVDNKLVFGATAGVVVGKEIIILPKVVAQCASPFALIWPN